jgi:hypothetical protein
MGQLPIHRNHPYNIRSVSSKELLELVGAVVGPMGASEIGALLRDIIG